MHIDLEKPLGDYVKKINLYHILVVLIIILTIFSRLTGLGTRVMSHDEVNHVVPAFDLFSGRGYRHDPVTHGPFQFPLMALSYFLFGDSDFTSRLPHALFSIATVLFILLLYKRYLGKYGAIAAAVFFMISPFMLFYGRYARNDAICAFWGVASFYVLLRYFETGLSKYLLMLAVLLSLNFSTKETAYIFTAQLIIFVFILVVMEIFKSRWEKRKRQKFLLINMVLVGVIAASIAVSVFFVKIAGQQIQNGQVVLSLGIPGQSYDFSALISLAITLIKLTFPILIPLIFSLGLLVFIKPILNWEYLKDSRVFPVFILAVTFVLPLLAPFLVIFSGQNPVAYNEPFPVLIDYIYIAYFFGLSVIIGTIWDEKNWWKYALVFFAIYITLFSTFFTNTVGILTGMIGSLGHWLAQQDVARGGQPSYYFAFILIPIYEFLGAFGTILAFYFGFKQRSFWSKSQNDSVENEVDPSESDVRPLLPIPAIFIFFTIISLIAYTLAGEKMPWLTVHIAFPLLLTAGWSFEKTIQLYLFQEKNKEYRWMRFLTLVSFMIFVILMLAQIWGNHAPFQGKTQVQLQDTNYFLFLIILITLSGYFLFKQYRRFPATNIFSSAMIVIYLLLGILTARASYRASFINFDYPYEFLVYAHAADGPKIVLNQIEEISKRTTKGLDIKVAYDNHGLYPYWWYLRNYPNKIVYLENPTRALEDAPLIIAGSDKYAKIDAIVRDNYYAYEYMRLWWPMQDYWNLTFDRIKTALINPEMRQALLNIWLNRDYSLYAQTTGSQFLTLENWLPSERMRFYVRKDIAAQMWQLNSGAPLETITTTDPYAAKMISRQPDYFISKAGSAAGDLNEPRGVHVAQDGSIFVADSNNNRIQQFSQTGELLNSWGVYANILEGNAPGGTLNQPWGVATGKDGSVYVVDTFNHRIQKFSSNGQFIKGLGVFAQGTSPETIWGPRGIAIGLDGNVVIADTGNKRVVIYDKDLNYITQFGGAGFEAGQFDEPVGIDISDTGMIAVADTWNRRIQLFNPDESGLVYTQTGEFEVDAWYGQSLDNKPFLTFSPKGTIFVSDPESGRILEFSLSGELLQGWQDLSISSELISRPYGLDFDAQGNLWVSDASMNVIMVFNAD
jgi:predicted membrane-bound mannosyltransferase/sugar lactone lactonase YvrE